MSTGPEVDLARIRASLEHSGYEMRGATPRVWWFGNTPELVRELGELVRDGSKKASAGSLWLWEAEGEALPKVGEIQVVIDWCSAPLAVVEITDVRVVAFNKVDDAFAIEEGEGDCSLQWWREAHWEYFSSELPQIGRLPSEDMPLVCTKFRLLHAVRAV